MEGRTPLFLVVRERSVCFRKRMLGESLDVYCVGDARSSGLQ